MSPTPRIPPPRQNGHGVEPYHVCFICTGNICRSPIAEVVLRHRAADTRLAGGDVLSKRLAVSSAGTGPWHVDEPMDPRAQAALTTRNLKDQGHRARQVDASWLADVDLVVCLDRRHRQTLRGLAPDLGDRMVLLREFAVRDGGPVDVDDPYYGELPDFVMCLEVIVDACDGLLGALVEVLG